MSPRLAGLGCLCSDCWEFSWTRLSLKKGAENNLCPRKFQVFAPAEIHLRKNHCVDYVDYAITTFDVSLHDISVVDLYFAIGDNDVDLTPLNCLGVLQLNHVSSHHFAGHNMIGENGDEFLFVFWLQQRVNGALR